MFNSTCASFGYFELVSRSQQCQKETCLYFLELYCSFKGENWYVTSSVVKIFFGGVGVGGGE